MHLTVIAGARPNFMKVAAIIDAARLAQGFECCLVHTGQHYDERMSSFFFEELGLPVPAVHLGVGSGNHAQQTARVMLEFDAALERLTTDMIVVVGDVNSTLACALVAVKRGLPIAHVEAGLRSGDRRMPEEINRVLTDQISDHLFTTERSAARHLLREGIASSRIHFVGNVMIDTLLKYRARARARPVIEAFGLRRGDYALCTLHRPSNVDAAPDALNTVLALEAVASRLPAIIPLHPRTRAKLESFGLLRRLTALPSAQVVEPLGYLDFVGLMDGSRLVFTDSGGIQEETTALGVPCLTFRDNTERPITVTLGTNRLVGAHPERVASAVESVLDGTSTRGEVPELWDGQAGARIIETLAGLRSRGAVLQPQSRQ